MLGNPKVWLLAAGGWLLLSGLAHSAAHLRYGITVGTLTGVDRIAVDAMNRATSTGPLGASLWDEFRTFSVGFGLLFYFTGVGNLLLWWTGVPLRALRTFTLLETVFWAFAFVLLSATGPVVGLWVAAGVAVPLHAVAFVTADRQLRSESGERP